VKEQNMGGSAFLLYGNIDSSLLGKKELKQNIIQKIFGIKRYACPTEIIINDKLTLVEIKNHTLDVLINEFKKYLLKTIPRPNSASEQFIDYLNIKTMSIRLRGNKSTEKTEWYVEFSFSGCAGMGQTSAELGSHWVEIWLNNERDFISDVLDKNGFKIDGKKDESAGYRFIPFKQYGYARILTKEEIYEDGDYEGSKYLTFDQAYIESSSDDELSKMKKLDHKYQNHINANKCYCQLCEPDFIPLII
jgi:hypothetical protein